MKKLIKWLQQRSKSNTQDKQRWNFEKFLEGENGTHYQDPKCPLTIVEITPNGATNIVAGKYIVEKYSDKETAALALAEANISHLTFRAMLTAVALADYLKQKETEKTNDPTLKVLP